jgi:hypothetical protein
MKTVPVRGLAGSPNREPPRDARPPQDSEKYRHNILTYSIVTYSMVLMIWI